MKKCACFKILTCALCLYVLCGCGGNSLRPDIATHGSNADASVSLPDDVKVNTREECAYIYELSTDIEPVFEQIERCLGLKLSDAERLDFDDMTMYSTDEYTVSILHESGYWTYDVKLIGGDSASIPITDDEAGEIARHFVAEHGLWTEDCSYTVVDQYGINGSGKYGVNRKSVFLYPKIGGVEVLGAFRINIDLDLNGNVISAYYMVNQIVGKTPVKLIDRADIQNKLLIKDYSASFSQNLSSTKINACDCAMYADAVSHDGKTYLFPVYVLTGEGKTESGGEESFDIIIDAQK